MLADERRREPHAAAGRLHGHPDAVERRLVRDGPDLRAGAEPEREHLEIEPLHHRSAGRIVGVDHGRARGLRRLGEQLEQPALGEPIALERAVEVQVVLRQIREDRHVERDPVGAREGQRVRRHLHRDAADAAVAHLREHRLEIQRLGRGLVGRQGLVAEHVPDRADDARGEAARAQQRLHQVRGRRLAVRPGDADEQELPRRVAVEGARELRERGPHRRDQHLRHRQVSDRLPLGDDDRGAPPDRVRDEAAAVLLEAGDRDEARAGLDAPRVARDRRHRARRLADHALLGERREQLAHGCTGHVTCYPPTRSA